jgi:hypothetical protein
MHIAHPLDLAVSAEHLVWLFVVSFACAIGSVLYHRLLSR